ncbi:MAG: D-tyrosyl-tRNA(Tyr) deacylase [Pseudomonadales bacterium]|nr:D-tyrosyl-tRNA(Tyr) deacylase [Pseudomonadales bacterium]
MRVLVQRVSQAAVDVGGERIGEIERGLLLFVGVFPNDGDAEVEWLAAKTLGLRVFPDGDKNMNLSVVDVQGALLVVSQFTLAADTAKGMRPGFSRAASPAYAQTIYDQFVIRLGKDAPVATGKFGADMQVSLVNDGPVTILLER